MTSPNPANLPAAAPTLADVHAAFGKWIELPKDTEKRPIYETIDVALAVAVANQMDGDACWLMLVASPSLGKTETIRAFDDVPTVYPLNSLTPRTFASGYGRDEDASLLPKLKGKTVTMKDFGSVLSMQRDSRSELLGQLREIYDGRYVKEFGNGRRVSWEGKIGLLVGVTEAIDEHYSVNQILGERFLLYRLTPAPPRATARRAMFQRSREKDSRAELRALVRDFLPTVQLTAPSISDALYDGIAALAIFTARGRTHVVSDRSGNVIHASSPEGTARIAKQLAILAQALAAVHGRGEVDATDYSTIRRVAWDTLPAGRRKTLLAVLSAGAPLTTAEFAERLRVPLMTARQYLERMVAVEMVDKVSGKGSGSTDRWKPSAVLERLLLEIEGPLSGQQQQPGPLGALGAPGANEKLTGSVGDGYVEKEVDGDLHPGGDVSRKVSEERLRHGMERVLGRLHVRDTCTVLGCPLHPAVPLKAPWPRRSLLRSDDPEMVERRLAGHGEACEPPDVEPEEGKP